jgi:hypothetical protein
VTRLDTIRGRVDRAGRPAWARPRPPRCRRARERTSGSGWCASRSSQASSLGSAGASSSGSASGSNGPAEARLGAVAEQAEQLGGARPDRPPGAQLGDDLDADLRLDLGQPLERDPDVLGLLLDLLDQPFEAGVVAVEGLDQLLPEGEQLGALLDPPGPFEGRQRLPEAVDGQVGPVGEGVGQGVEEGGVAEGLDQPDGGEPPGGAEMFERGSDGEVEGLGREGVEAREVEGVGRARPFPIAVGDPGEFVEQPIGVGCRGGAVGVGADRERGHRSRLRRSSEVVRHAPRPFYAGDSGRSIGPERRPTNPIPGGAAWIAGCADRPARVQWEEMSSR